MQIAGLFALLILGGLNVNAKLLVLLGKNDAFFVW